MKQLTILNGSELKKFRRKHNITQQGMAIIMGFKRNSYQPVIDHESGKRDIVKVSCWERLESWAKDNGFKLGEEDGK